VFEQDLLGIKVGQKVMMRTESLPGKEFKSTVDFIHPVLDKMNRAIKVRLSVSNKKNILKPGMLVRGSISLKGSVEKLLIPESAPLLTGERAVVYVELEAGVYTGKNIVLGEHIGNYYEVLDGLTENDVVVSRGAFKIDAAMQIQALPSVMYPQGEGPAGAHNHGEMQKESGMKANIELEVISLSKKEKQWLIKIYDDYIVFQQALSNDDHTVAKKALISMSKSMHRIPKKLDDGHGHHRAAGYNNAAVSGDINLMRTELLSLSNSIIQWLKQTALEPPQGAAVYFCPMANNNKGAEWLQVGGDVKNPYYGSAMISCGEQRSVLSDPQGGK
jgi:Cu(I)/Ag(I) efflux system membrane fusion protein